MADKKHEDKNTRKLTRMGGKSLGLTLPIELVRLKEEAIRLLLDDSKPDPSYFQDYFLRFALYARNGR